jgi:alkylated DNA repair dioxygenase AlkB
LAVEEPASGPGEIRVDPEVQVGRVRLDETSWVDVARGWLLGADTLFGLLRDGVAWETSRLFRYDHWVEEHRLVAAWRPGSPLPHPALASVHRALERRYDVRFTGFSLIQYRNGRDGQAFHRDTDMRWLDDTVIAVLSLGAERPWQLRPRSSRHDHSESRGVTHDLAPRSGDLVVMGGRCQADWEHSVPYRPREQLGARIAIQWRYASHRGRQFVGPSYRAPLTFRPAGRRAGPAG